jgi:hypothetical protein
LSKFISSEFLDIKLQRSKNRGTVSVLVEIEEWRKIRKELVFIWSQKQSSAYSLTKELKDKMQDEHFHPSFYVVKTHAPPFPSPQTYEDDVLGKTLM